MSKVIDLIIDGDNYTAFQNVSISENIGEFYGRELCTDDIGNVLVAWYDASYLYHTENDMAESLSYMSEKDLETLRRVASIIKNAIEEKERRNEIRQRT